MKKNINNLRTKIETLLKTSSDAQILMIHEVIKPLVYSKEWSENNHKESRNFTTNGLSSPVNIMEDVSEGNYGSLYRNNE